MKVEELKEKARRHELREEWQKAFDLYKTALRNQDEAEPADITLFNRLGDIQTRLGQINGAVEHYEKAIDLYLEAELPNNAIAICKKVLRNLPERNIFFLRMGQIRAGQGFLTDARQNFLAYAERQTTLGDIESALNALIEFVDLSPEDLEIRRSLAAQLESHDRTEEAIEQYLEVYRLSILMEQDEEANGALEKLEELAPDLALPDPESIRSEAQVPEAEEMAWESTSLAGFELDDWGEDEGVGLEKVEIEPGIAGLGDEENRGREAGGKDEEPTPDPETVEARTEEAATSPDEREETDDLPTFDFDPDLEAGDAEALPAFDFEGVKNIAGEEEDDLSFIGLDDDEGVSGEAEPLPLLGSEEAEEFEAEVDDGLPLLSLDEDAEDVGGDSDDLRIDAAMEAAFEDASFESTLEALEEPETDTLEPEDTGAGPLPGDHKEAADRGDMGLAIDRVRALIEVDPDNVEIHQRLVEYAFRKNDQEVLVSAYLELAGCLARTGAPTKANAVYRQVLALSPGHEGATLGIQALGGAAGATAPAQVASSEEYVDLGSMILGEEAERSTRWKVAAEAPSGDDEADFAKMLGQFKEKVSEHVAADDVAAHHDLGTAYMEMGLFEEAVAEFQMALRASPAHLPTHEVMGRCWMKMGKPDMAIRALNRALNVPHEVEDELIGIYYLMGRAQEDEGNNGMALEFYEKVFSLDINFEDVTDRLRALR
jgi:tetratricopeptide (TPR) repeat protein